MNIAQLIRTHRGERSYDQLERDCGGALSSQRWQQLGVDKPMYEFLKAATIRTIALGLQVSEAEVIIANAESLGFHILDHPRIMSYIPAGSERLSDLQLHAVSVVIRAMLDESAAPEEPQDPPAASGTFVRTVPPKRAPTTEGRQ